MEFEIINHQTIQLINISPSYRSHLLHDAELLCVNETLQQHSNRHVYVVVLHRLAEMHSGMCLRHSNDALDVPNGDWKTASGERFLSQIRVHLGDLVLVHVLEGG